MMFDTFSLAYSQARVLAYSLVHIDVIVRKLLIRENAFAIIKSVSRLPMQYETTEMYFSVVRLSVPFQHFFSEKKITCFYTFLIHDLDICFDF